VINWGRDNQKLKGPKASVWAWLENRMADYRETCARLVFIEVEANLVLVWPSAWPSQHHEPEWTKPLRRLPKAGLLAKAFVEPGRQRVRR
jgi:hypothetical protein